MPERTPEQRAKSAAQAREWRAKNPERARELARIDGERRRARDKDGIWPDGKERRLASCHPERRFYSDDLCRSCWHKRYYAANRDGLLTYAREHRPSRTERRDYQTLKVYGLTPDERAALLKQQGNVCPICLEPFSETISKLWEAVDHDHESGAVRGILHRKCNTAIGLLADDLDRARRVVAYLSPKEP